MCPDSNELSSGGEDTTLIAVLGGGCVTDSELIANTIARRQLKIPLVSEKAYENTYDGSKISSTVVLFCLGYIDFLQPTFIHISTFSFK